jgi:hypothetical protein
MKEIPTVRYYDYWESVFNALSTISLESEVEDGDPDIILQGAEALYKDIQEASQMDGNKKRENTWTFTFADGRKLTIHASAEISESEDQL